MGGPEESVLAPAWRDDAALYAVSDASGFWNLYEVPAAAGRRGRCIRSTRNSPGPLWQLGERPFEPLGDGRLAVLHGLGEYRLGVLDPGSGELTDIDLPGYRTAHGELAASGNTVTMVAGGPRTPWSVLRVGRPPEGGGGRADGQRSRPTPPTLPTCLTRARYSCPAARTAAWCTPSSTRLPIPA